MVFEGFETQYTDCPSGARVFSYVRKARSAAPLPVLVLLHGYPQNALKWKHFVNEIPDEWNLLVPDLPGYGNSTKPIKREDNSLAFSKREIGKDILHVVDSIWDDKTKLIPYGHDRGARIAYRLALDFPDRIAGAALLDIVPTSYVWGSMSLENNNHFETKRSHHWVFLASPHPLPETMIASNPQYYYEYTMTGWIGSAMRSADLDWVKDAVAPYVDPEKGKDRIAAACEDYRAGSTHDVDHDFEASINPLLKDSTAGPRFKCPLLVLSSFHIWQRFDVDKIWTDLSEKGAVQSYAIGDKGTGHFLVNEAQEEVGQRTREWLKLFQKK